MPENELVAVNGAQEVAIFNPLDAEPVQFTRALIVRQQNYDALAMHLRGMLVPDKDFGRIHVAGKKKCERPWACSPQAEPYHWSPYMLFAAGADKVLGILGLGVQYPGEQDVMRAALTGKPILEVILKCQVIDHKGQIIAEEMGACARAEVNDSLNNAIKRAAKRARVGAVLRLPSISALFESDFLAEIETAAVESSNANSTAARARQMTGDHNSGAELDCMPFGKHKGDRFHDLPGEYLQWIIQNMANKPDILAAAIKETKARGFSPGETSEPPAASQDEYEHMPPVNCNEDDFDDEIPF